MVKKQIVFDVMLRERFVATLRMPITFGVIVGYKGDNPIVSETAIKAFVNKKLPTLKNEPYNIAF